METHASHASLGKVGLALVMMFSVAACTASTGADDDLTVAGSDSALKTKPPCPVPEPARRGAPLIPRASVAAKLDAWKQELAAFQAALPAAESAAAAHAAEYAAASSTVTGKSCVVDADCATGHANYSGHCNRYVWTGSTGSCQVVDLAPVGTTAPPPPPIFACSDYSCPASFQCEVENGTGAVGCVEGRTCIPAGGGGGGGGGHRGGR